jgi:hypothetical protein
MIIPQKLHHRHKTIGRHTNADLFILFPFTNQQRGRRKIHFREMIAKYVEDGEGGCGHVQFFRSAVSTVSSTGI